MARSSEEIWKPVVGFEGYYEVSSHGRVKRIKAGQGARPGIRKSTISGPKGYGYVAVSLSRDNKAVTKKVHRLVLEAFVGPCPEGMEGCHLDDDPLNNHLENLKWDTHKNNCQARSLNGKPVKKALLKPYCRNGHAYPDNPKMYRGARICAECDKEKRARYLARARTGRSYVYGEECRRNHAWTEENIYIDPKGRRHCRACRSLAEARRKARKEDSNASQ